MTVSSSKASSSAQSAPNFVPCGLATGIGSLPHRDPQRAVELVLRQLPRCPFWPQLPQRSALEGMTLQYLEGFPALREQPAGGDPVVATGADGEAELVAYYEKVLGRDLEAFAVSTERAPGFYAFEQALVQSPPTNLAYVKAHVTGPVTLATSLKDQDGRDVLHSDAFCEAIAALAAQKAVWQVRRLARYGVPVIVFFDEPVMEVYGSAYSTLNREQVLALWQPALSAVAEAGALSGIHCCGNTDWALLFASGTDIVNFDAYHFLDKMLLYPEAAGEYLQRGGVLAWGAVPTSEEALAVDADQLLTALDRGIGGFAAAGLAEEQLRRQCLLTPSCGMGSLSESLAERILRLLGQVSDRFEA